MAKISKKTLKEKAENNTTVTKGTSKNQEMLKKGIPNDHSRKKENNIVGMSLGITKNMDNYESLRVDCWLQDYVNDNETKKEAFQRVNKILDEVLQETVQSYID